MSKFALLLLIILLPSLSFAQLDSVLIEEPVDTYPRKDNYWTGYVFQLSPDYNPNNDYSRTFTNNSGADRQFKGYLKYNDDFLPSNSLNFDTRFGDFVGAANDSLFFETNGLRDVNTDSSGYNVQLQHFGVIFTSRIIIPANQPGIYRFTVGSDDGTRLNVQGFGTLHNNWGGPKTYNYNENIINYYLPYEGGERINVDLSYYERKGANRVSFHFERYLGPGEIEGSQDLCGLSPDPTAFGSRGPAAFLEGSISYQWQYSSVNDTTSSNWTDIEGAIGLVYDVPQYNSNDSLSWTGPRYFRRLATNNANGIETEYPSNVLTVNLSLIVDWNQQEFGQNEWIGHIYRGIGDFTNNAYLGRMQEDSIFIQNFNYNNTPSSPNDFSPGYGCEFLTEKFSVRYKMKLDVSPGTYDFKVRGDDGFRLSVDGGATWAVNDWENGGPEAYRSAVVEINTVGQLDLVLEYYENTQGNLIDFTYEFNARILPLEWGEVMAWACEQSNCLNWETLQEKNTSHFELERSYDGMAWDTFESRIQASGYSTEKNVYTALDSNFMNNVVYYRIKQVDLDGTFAYSEILRVKNSLLPQAFLPFPNPTTDKIRFFSKSEVTQLHLISHDYAINREMKIVKVHDHMYEVDLSDMKSGNYVLTAQKKNAEKEVFKIIKK